VFRNYPGNIRELENIIEHAFVLCPEGQIEVHCLPETLSRFGPPPVVETDIHSAVESAETRLILDALQRSRYNCAAARDLGIHKSTPYRKMKKLGVDLPGKELRASESARPGPAECDDDPP